MMIAGVDDAGRGAVIGPIIIAGVLFKEHQITRLYRLGVKDSKTLSANRRRMLSKEIKKMAIQWKIVEISPSDVDKVVLEGKKFHRLNWLEAKAMAEVIKGLHPEIVYVDASDVNETRFAQQIRNLLPFEVKIISEHHADTKYTIVGAASIIAKVHRDDSIAILREKYGNFGSGYSGDPYTRLFLLKWFKKKKEVPSDFRKSWKTIKRLMEKT